MSTVTTDNDFKKLGGYIKQKMTILGTRWSDDEVTRAIEKVCGGFALKIPNEKHMQRLINATYGQYNTGGNEYGNINKYIADDMEKHLHAHNWIAVLKTAIAFHRLMQDGSDAFNVAVQDKRGLFSLSHIKDLADSPDGAEQQIFITHYLRYLEERAVAQAANYQRMKALRIENQGFQAQLMTLTGREAVATCSALLLQFETAVDVQFLAHSVNNFATLQGHKNVLNDAKLLFVAISRKMVSILEKIETFSPEDREMWLPIYKRYAICSRKFAAKLTEMSTSRVAWGEQLPQIRPLPDDVLEQLSIVLDPKHGTRHGAVFTVPTGNGEMPRMKLAELVAQQHQVQQMQGRVSPREGGSAAAAAASSGNPPILSGEVITGGAPQSKALASAPHPQDNKQITTMSDIFSPMGGQQQPQQPKPAGGMPDLFAQAPSRPQVQTGGGGGSVDLFGGAPSRPQNNTVDIFGAAPVNNRAPPVSNNNNGLDIFGPAPVSTSSSANTSQPASTNTNAPRQPLDPFATITNNTAPQGSPAVQQQQQPRPAGINTGGNSGMVDFFAAPSSNRGPQQPSSNTSSNANAPAFDPFAPAGADGRSRAW